MRKLSHSVEEACPVSVRTRKSCKANSRIRPPLHSSLPTSLSLPKWMESINTLLLVVWSHRSPTSSSTQSPCYIYSCQKCFLKYRNEQIRAYTFKPKGLTKEVKAHIQSRGAKVLGYKGQKRTWKKVRNTSILLISQHWPWNTSHLCWLRNIA